MLVAALLERRDAPGPVRASPEEALANPPVPGSVTLRTCHRLEWYATTGVPRPETLTRARWLGGEAVARHVIRLAVGLESIVLAEDQVLHQLRGAIAGSRATGPLPPELDRLLDDALRAGRTARSWMPPGPRNLAAAAYRQVATDAGRLDRVLVVGAGEMGRLAARAARAAGSRVSVASRDEARAERLALELGTEAAAFDPGPAVAHQVDLVMVALAGPWQVGPSTVAALAERRPWIVDLSSPPASPADVVTAAGGRWLGLQDVHGDARPQEARLRERLERLADDTIEGYLRWADEAPRRTVASETAAAARALRDRELAALFARLSSVTTDDRAEIARMAARLSDGIVGELMRRTGPAR